jgi:DNA-binding Lrp family transcriptional regulator
MSKKLDLYDQKILYELDKNSRTPASQIAKKLSLSKVSVNQRIKKLQEKGIIKNFMTQVDYRLLGYNIYHVYYKLQNISSGKESEFFSYLCSLKAIAYVARIDGVFDVFSVVMSKTNEDLDLILHGINHKYGQFIKEKNILMVLNASYFGRRYLIKLKEEKFTGPVIRKKPEKTIELDEINCKLLSTISLNARMPVTELTKKLNLSKDVIHYRLKRLIKEKVIQKFTIDINHEKFGNSFFKLLIKFNYRSNENEFISKISTNVNLIRTIRLLGGWDIELDFEVKDNKEMRKIIKELKEELGGFIQDYGLLFVYEIDKLNYYPF